MNIRKANIYDARAITDMWAKLMEEVQIPFRTCNEMDKENFFTSTLLNINRGSQLYVVAEQSSLRGYMHSCYTTLDYSCNKLIMKCEGIYVSPVHRSGTLADDLIDYTVKHFKQHGAGEFDFETVYNPSTIKFWERRGFTPIQVTYAKIDKEGQYR